MNINWVNKKLYLSSDSVRPGREELGDTGSVESSLWQAKSCPESCSSSADHYSIKLMIHYRVLCGDLKTIKKGRYCSYCFVTVVTFLLTQSTAVIKWVTTDLIYDLHIFISVPTLTKSKSYCLCVVTDTMHWYKKICLRIKYYGLNICGHHLDCTALKLTWRMNWYEGYFDKDSGTLENCCQLTQPITAYKSKLRLNHQHIWTSSRNFAPLLCLSS